MLGGVTGADYGNLEQSQVHGKLFKSISVQTIYVAIKQFARLWIYS